MKEIQNSPVNVPKKVLMGIVAIAALFITLFVLSGIMEDCLQVHTLYGLRVVLTVSGGVMSMSTTRPTRLSSLV